MSSIKIRKKGGSFYFEVAPLKAKLRIFWGLKPPDVPIVQSFSRWTRTNDQNWNPVELGYYRAGLITWPLCFKVRVQVYFGWGYNNLKFWTLFQVGEKRVHELFFHTSRHGTKKNFNGGHIFSKWDWAISIAPGSDHVTFWEFIVSQWVSNEREREKI